MLALQIRHLRPREFRKGIQMCQLVSRGFPNTGTELLHSVASVGTNLVELKELKDESKTQGRYENCI